MRLHLPRCGHLLFLLVPLAIFPDFVHSQAPFSQFNPSGHVRTQTAGLSEVSNDRLIFLQLWDDLLYLTSEPDFYLTVGGLGLAPSIFPSAFKQESPEFTELWGSSKFADNLFELGETMGDGAFPVLVCATSWSIGKITGSSRLREFGTDLFRAQVVNGLFTTALKSSINRTRADGGSHSYPLGHTSSAFATAGVVYAHFGETCGIPAFVVAGYVGLSRLQEGKHYVSDIIAGGILGSYISLKLARHGSNRGPVSIRPLTIGSGVGLSLTVRF